MSKNSIHLHSSPLPLAAQHTKSTFPCHPGFRVLELLLEVLLQVLLQVSEVTPRACTRAGLRLSRAPCPAVRPAAPPAQPSASPPPAPAAPLIKYLLKGEGCFLLGGGGGGGGGGLKTCSACSSAFSFTSSCDSQPQSLVTKKTGSGSAFRLSSSYPQNHAHARCNAIQGAERQGVLR